MPDMLAQLTDSQTIITCYETNGYGILKGAYSNGHIEGITEELTKAKIFNYDIANDVYNLLNAFPSVVEIVNSSPLKNIVQTLLGVGAFPVRAMIIDKTKSQNWVLDWHQDRRVAVESRIDTVGFSNWSNQYGVHHACAPAITLQNFLVARISLDNITEENGAIFVVSGTHRSGIFDAEQMKSIVNKSEPLCCIMEPGDLMIMSPLLIHNSPGSQNPANRRVLSIEL